MFRLYRESAGLAVKRAAKAWPAAFSLLVFAAVLLAAFVLLGRFALVGGILVGLVGAACMSSYLYLMARAVEGRPLQLRDLKDGVVVYFWDVISVGFALFLIGFLIEAVARSAGPNAPALRAMANLALAFFLNPVPELLYLQRTTRSFGLLLTSSRFMLAHPVVWFLPTLLFVTAMMAVTGQLPIHDPRQLLIDVPNALTPTGIMGLVAATADRAWWAVPLVLLFIHFAMVFRGVLFQALASGNNDARRRAWISQTTR